MDEGTGRALGDALATVKLQQGTMRKCLDADQLMDALKAASTMLAELRTSSLSPKQYYELYIAVFDALRHLSAYLYDAHQSGKHHLADLYELVQYAGNIVPRLYLMITVGAVYMSVESPRKEIMKDMMEMARGVQHPTRGLFLRFYLSGMTREHLPIGDDQGPLGNLYDSIGFVLTNFIEMNKLWVRLQHQGLSRDREKREIERRELRILVGTNLVRLSQLDGVDLDMYRRIILPAVLEQVVNCKDIIAQDYLMEVVIQVFTDDFHLRTLGPFLSATAQLHPKVNIKQIVIALIDRLAAYAAREAENDENNAPSDDSPSEQPPQSAAVDASAEQPNASSTQLNGHASSLTVEQDHSHAQGTANASTTGTEHDAQLAKAAEHPEKASQKFRGIPQDVKLFEVFWHQVIELIKARPDLNIQDVTALIVSLANLSLSCYPDRIDYIDQVLSFAMIKTDEYVNSADLYHPITVQHLQSLLLAPVRSYVSPLMLLQLSTYTPLLLTQPYATRKIVGHAIISSMLKHEGTVVSTPEEVKGILDLCHVLIRDQKDANVGMPTPFGHSNGMSNGRPQHYMTNGMSRGMLRGQSQRNVQPYNFEEMATEQGWVARLIQLFRADDDAVQFKLLQTARMSLSDGGDRIRWTYPPLISMAIQLAKTMTSRESEDGTFNDHATFSTLLPSLYRFIHQVITHLYNSPTDASDVCLRLHLLAMQAADVSNLDELAYEFAVQAFTIYEESISESTAQLQAVTLLITTLQTSRVFTADNYDTLITKAALHAAKLLKKGHQATAVMLASHMFWQLEAAGGKEKQDKPLCKDAKRVLECLQKALRIAASCIDELTTMQLYVDVLDKYIYFFERQVETITPKHINSLVELITSNIDNLGNADSHASHAPAGVVDTALQPELVTQHFRATLAYLSARRETAVSTDGSRSAEEADSSSMADSFAELDLVGSLLKMGVQ